MLIDGRKIAEKILEEIKSVNINLSRKLALVLVGNDVGSVKFLELKKKAAKKVGPACAGRLEAEIFKFEKNIAQENLESEIQKLADDENIGGIIVEIPLPAHIITEKILNIIPVSKDPDVLSEEAQAKFYSGNFEILPPAVEAVRQIIKEIGFNIKGKECTVFGQGILVGKPVAYWLSSIGGKVSIIDEPTPEPGKISSRADLIVSGVGKQNLITPEMVKPGAVLIDFGYSIADGKPTGDINPEALKKASFFTPVPGGVGPVVVASVITNTVKLITEHEH